MLLSALGQLCPCLHCLLSRTETPRNAGPLSRGLVVSPREQTTNKLKGETQTPPMVLNRSTGSSESPSVQLDLDEDGDPDYSVEASGWRTCPRPSGPARFPARGLSQVGSCHRLMEAVLPPESTLPCTPGEQGEGEQSGCL